MDEILYSDLYVRVNDPSDTALLDKIAKALKAVSGIKPILTY